MSCNEVKEYLFNPFWKSGISQPLVIGEEKGWATYLALQLKDSITNQRKNLPRDTIVNGNTLFDPKTRRTGRKTA